MLETLLQIQMDEKLVQLAEDVQYYLGFFLLVREMKGRGYSFCMPEETEKLEVKQGYDLALALRSEKEVIANEKKKKKDERFFVITGANGGGKTTYARMVGQILYFAKMGLLVPCEKAGVPNYTTILSHFSNDESEMSGKGKLVEELTRLKPMMSGKPIAGTVFSVKSVTGSYSTSVTTGTDGSATLSAIPAGVYVVREESVPEPYIVTNTEQTVALRPGKTSEVTFVDYEKPGLEIVKKNIANGEPIEGVTYRIDARCTITRLVRPGLFMIWQKVPARTPTSCSSPGPCRC